MSNENVSPCPPTQISSSSSRNDENAIPTVRKDTSFEQEEKRPPASRQRQQKHKDPSIHVQRQWAIAKQYPELTPGRAHLDPWEPDRQYFFYGTLMDSKLLASILDLESEPQLKPAHVMGYRTKLWGPFPAMIYAHGQCLHGVGYEIASHQEVERQVAKLQAYETNRYRRHPVFIRYEDGTQCMGWTFHWNGDEKDLQEGVFDLKAWQTEFHDVKEKQ